MMKLNMRRKRGTIYAGFTVLLPRWKKDKDVIYKPCQSSSQQSQGIKVRSYEKANKFYKNCLRQYQEMSILIN